MINLTHSVLHRYATTFYITKEKQDKKKIPELYSHSLFISTVPYNMNVSMCLFPKCLKCNVNPCAHESKSSCILKKRFHYK